MSQRPTGSELTPLRRLLAFLRPYRGRAIAAGIALLLAAGSVLAIGQGLQRVVDAGFMQANSRLLDRMLLATLVVVVVLALASATRFYLVSWIGERIAADLRQSVFARLLTLEPAFFERNGVGEVQSRVTTDTTLLQSILGSSFSMALRNMVLLIGTLVMLIVTSPKLATYVVLGLPLVFAPILLIGQRVRRLSRSSQDRVADVGSYAGETLNAIATVQSFGHEPEDRERFNARVATAFTTAVSRVRQRALLTGAAMLLVFTAVGVILWQGGHDVLAGRMTAGQLAAFVFYAVLAAGSVGALSEVAGDLMRAAGAAERLFELLDARAAIAAPAAAQHLPEPVRGEISLDNLGFAYPTRPETPALDDVTLTIRPGERLALVGPSGAGKSTLFALLLRFHDPISGTIRFDGIDIRTLDPRTLRRHIGMVAQEPVLFTGNAWDNLRYGRPDAGDGAVLHAAEAANCTAFLQALPNGLETPLGPSGIQLSGGQRQRLAIARAILRDPALLLLDEATSNLDAESEQRIQTALDTLMRGRTSIVIAHRLATVVAADRIAVMEAGRITAIGQHRQLLRRSTLYARLVELQFGRQPT